MQLKLIRPLLTTFLIARRPSLAVRPSLRTTTIARYTRITRVFETQRERSEQYKKHLLARLAPNKPSAIS